MRTILITEEQAKILSFLGNDNHMTIKENKTPSIYDQVKKVNSGLMDNAAFSMEENTQIENDKYKIGKELNGDFYHISVNEETDTHQDLKKYINEINDFIYDQGLNIKPYPKVEFNDTKQDGLFISTGHYEPQFKKVVLYCDNRHPKDILRSYAHELIHHSQNLDGKNLSFTSNDNVKDNNELEIIEKEAYLLGNIFFRKWTEYVKNRTLNENISYINDMEEDMNPDDVDLSSFNIKHSLNPKFWKDGRLDSRVRLKLLDIADDFIEFLSIDWVKPEDIVITGSIANFTWNKDYSDVDLHIKYDFSKIDDRTEFVDNYFFSQKKLWNETHKDIKIFGFPVEVFVEDINNDAISSGIYSLESDDWVEKPNRDDLTSSKVNKTLIRQKVAEYADAIDNLYDLYQKNTNDEYKIRKIGEKANALFNKIKNVRKNSLDKTKKEISNGNIIFKSLRRMNYIDKLSKIKNKTYDKLASLNENTNTPFDVYLMFGAPGAGKSYWAKHNLPNLPIVSRDIIRSMDEIGISKDVNDKKVGTFEQEQLVTIKEYELIDNYCKKQQSFVIDDTNLKQKYRQKLINTLRKYNARIIIVVVFRNAEDCIKNRENTILRDVMEKILSNINLPNAEECDKILIVDNK